jgi:hypothetical protein
LAHGIVRCQHRINHGYEGRALQPILGDSRGYGQFRVAGATRNGRNGLPHELRRQERRLAQFGHLAGSVLALHLDLAVSVDFEKLLAEQQAK